jgi:hypothetical protein
LRVGGTGASILNNIAHAARPRRTIDVVQRRYRARESTRRSHVNADDPMPGIAAKLATDYCA